MEVHQKHTIRRHYKIVVTHNKVRKSRRVHNKEALKSTKSAQQGATKKQQELTMRRHQRAT